MSIRPFRHRRPAFHQRRGTQVAEATVDRDVQADSTPISRREEILRTAAEVFATEGLARATVRDIANKAGILSGSLYHHFDSKESMIDELLSRFWRESIAANERAIAEGSDPRDRLRRMLAEVLRGTESRAPEFLILHNDWHYLAQFERFSYIDESAARTEQLWVQVLEDGIRSGVFRSDLDPRIMYRTIMGAALWVVQWYKPNGSMSMRQIAEAQADIFFSGICTRA
jgi:AcrR family transcriptional regulator